MIEYNQLMNRQRNSSDFEDEAEDNLAEGARQFAERMKQGAYKEATKIKSDFGLPNSMLSDAVKSAYDANMKRETIPWLPNWPNNMIFPATIVWKPLRGRFIER